RRTKDGKMLGCIFGLREIVELLLISAQVLSPIFVAAIVVLIRTFERFQRRTTEFRNMREFVGGERPNCPGIDNKVKAHARIGELAHAPVYQLVVVGIGRGKLGAIARVTDTEFGQLGLDYVEVTVRGIEIMD